MRRFTLLCVSTIILLILIGKLTCLQISKSQACKLLLMKFKTSRKISIRTGSGLTRNKNTTLSGFLRTDLTNLKDGSRRQCKEDLTVKRKRSKNLLKHPKRFNLKIKTFLLQLLLKVKALLCLRKKLM